MYSVVLATAMMATATTTTWHHRCNSCSSCYSCYGCGCSYSGYSGYAGYAGYACSGYGCYSCYSVSGYGCAGACYGYHGGCYSGWGIHSGEPYLGGCTGCYGCYGGYAGYGIPVPFPQGAPNPNAPMRDPFPPINPEAGPRKGSPETVVPPEEKKKAGGMGENGRAKIRLEIPVGAKLYVDGRLIQTTPGTRIFNTPALQMGQTYFYDIRIEVERDGVVQTEQRRVIIRSGDDVAVNFPNKTTPAVTARRGQ